MYNKTTQVERHPMSYFMANKNQVIDNLKLKILDLKGQLYICDDFQVPYIQEQIKNVEKAIRFNKALR